MFIYLSKKIAIPNGVRLKSIAWNTDQGWIACGGENGLLKVLKLENGKGAVVSNNLSMNQTLDGHERGINVVAWNDQHRKLTSSDENGLIIVWILHKGMWFEEMINNRNRSVVRDVSWNSDGSKVCIVYEDGAVIVGSVDGNRLWGKELKKQLTNVTWSPDGRFLLFGTLQGDVLVHESGNGSYRTKVFVQCVDEGTENKLAGLTWFSGSGDALSNPASLAVVYENGKAQLMRSESDDKPYLIDSGLKVASVRWNPHGTIVAIAGIPSINAGEKAVVAVQFYSNNGVHLRTLRVPGSSCGGVSWEGNGLRICLAVDSFIFFANVRPDYKWAYFNKTAVYAFSKPERADTCIMFYNVKSYEKNIKYVHRLTHVKAAGDCCAIVSRVEENAAQHVISLNNAVGGPVDTKYIDIEPQVVAMSEHYVIAASEEMLLVWQYRNPNVVVDALDPASIQASRKETKDRLLHIDDVVTGDQQHNSLIKKGLTNDHACCVAVSGQYCFLGRESGLLQVYTLNPIALVARISLPTRAQQLFCNCNSTTLAVIDLNGLLTLHKIIPETFSVIAKPSQQYQFERKDVWDMMWATDNPEMFAAMEKTRMYVFRGLDPEEPLQSSAHICKFKSLKIRSLLIDDMVLDPEHPSKETTLDFETKSLRDTREILRSVSRKEAFQYVEDHPHPKLWSILAEAALETLDFTVAEKAVVRCNEYPAIQFVKRIKSLDDPLKQRAEVLAYYHRFDEAEKVFKEMDRKDLAVDLRARLGDWFRVVQLVQEGGGDDALIHNAWEQIGDFYFDRQKWTKAVQYYSQCRNYAKLSKVYCVLEDFKALEKMLDAAQHSKELFVTIAHQFLSVGMVEAAVNAFLKAGETRMAVTACVDQAQWDQAIHLAEKHSFADIGELLSAHATSLVDRDRVPQAIELYRKAGLNNEAAKLLARLGQQMAAAAQPLKAKKYYVVAALEIEKFRKKQVVLDARSAATVVDNLLNADKVAVTDKSMDAAWRGAEAFHFYLLSQLHLYNNKVDLALAAAMRLMEFDDILPAVNLYSLVALTAYYARNYGICSKAFTRLENLEMGDVKAAADASARLMSAEAEFDLTATNATIALPTASAAAAAATAAGGGGASGGASASAAGSGASRGPGGRLLLPTISLQDVPRRFGDLAIRIFTRNAPVDTSVDKVKCLSCNAMNREWASACGGCGKPFAACIVTARAIPEGTPSWQCGVCRHRALPEAIDRFANCPLCHAPILVRS